MASNSEWKKSFFSIQDNRPWSRNLSSQKDENPKGLLSAENPRAVYCRSLQQLLAQHFLLPLMTFLMKNRVCLVAVVAVLFCSMFFLFFEDIFEGNRAICHLLLQQLFGAFFRLIFMTFSQEKGMLNLYMISHDFYAIFDQNRAIYHLLLQQLLAACFPLISMIFLLGNMSVCYMWSQLVFAQ